VSFGSQNTKVDVLDLYFPRLGDDPLPAGIGTSQQYAANVYTTTCLTPDAINPACPRNIPTGTTIRYTATFVNAQGTPVVPAGTYAWDSTAGADVPPSQMVDLTITVEWTQRGRLRTFALRSLIGDRKFGGVKIRAEANVEFGVQVLTSFTNPAGEVSELLALGGIAESSIEARLLSTADSTVRAADISLTKLPTALEPTATDLDNADGATATLHAPPNNSDTAGAPAATVTHPEVFDPNNPAAFLDVAGVDSTNATDLSVGIANEKPEASGGFSYSPGAGQLDFWVQSQVDPLNNDLRKLDSAQPVFSIRGKHFEGSSTGVTGALGAADRRVETRAAMELDGMRLLPTNFIGSVDNSLGGALISVTDFVGEAHCSSTASAVTASATAGWSATLSYWADPVNDGLREDAPVDDRPRYVVQTINGTAGGDPLAAIKLANPLVFDGDLPTDDVYLFEDPGAVVPRSGYLVDWSSLKNVAGESDGTGRFTQAQIPGAIKIDTAPTNPLLPESGLNVQIGQLSCEALDDR
jgi:hypothetical protein